MRALKHPFDHRFYLAPAPRDTPSLSRLYNVLFNFETFKTAALIFCGVRERLVTRVFYPARPFAIFVWPGLAYPRLFCWAFVHSRRSPSNPPPLRHPFFPLFIRRNLGLDVRRGSARLSAMRKGWNTRREGRERREYTEGGHTRRDGTHRGMAHTEGWHKRA